MKQRVCMARWWMRCRPRRCSGGAIVTVALTPRQRKLLNRLLDAEPEGVESGMTLHKAASLTGVSRATAWRDLSELVALQALEPIGAGRSRAYRISTGCPA